MLADAMGRFVASHPELDDLASLGHLRVEDVIPGVAASAAVALGLDLESDRACQIAARVAGYLFRLSEAGVPWPVAVEVTAEGDVHPLASSRPASRGVRHIVSVCFLADAMVSDALGLR